jgi:S1-C subfamily serine protease
VTTRPARRRWLQAVACSVLAGGVFGSGAAAAGLPEVIARLRGSVLPIGTFSPTDSPRFGFRGTCFVVGDGQLVATNFHVLPPATEMVAGSRLAVMAGREGDVGQLRMATLVGSDRARDLALLRIDGPPLQPLALDSAGSAREGQSIGLMGYPIGGALGFSPVTHRGIVASVTQIALQAPTAQQLDPRAISRLRSGNFEVLQLDATAYPGNSGGPVFDAESGVVLAVLNMVLVKSSRESALSQPTGISYAIPVLHLLALLAEQVPPR